MMLSALFEILFGRAGRGRIPPDPPPIVPGEWAPTDTADWLAIKASVAAAGATAHLWTAEPGSLTASAAGSAPISPGGRAGGVRDHFAPSVVSRRLQTWSPGSSAEHRPHLGQSSGLDILDCDSERWPSTAPWRAYQMPLIDWPVGSGFWLFEGATADLAESCFFELGPFRMVDRLEEDVLAVRGLVAQRWNLAPINGRIFLEFQWRVANGTFAHRFPNGNWVTISGVNFASRTPNTYGVSTFADFNYQPMPHKLARLMLVDKIFPEEDLAPFRAHILAGSGITDTGPDAPTPPPPGAAHNDVGGLDIPGTEPSRPAINVSTAAQLSSALSGAQKGDRIVLANGTYSGNFTLSTNGTADEPIIVRAANPHGATITGTFNLRGNWGVLYQLNMAAADIRDCSDCRISRCYVNDGGGISCRDCPRITLDYNEVRNYSGRGIEIRPGTGASRPFRCWTHHNYVKDQVGTANRAAIAYSGGALAASDVDHDGLVEFNLSEGNNATTAIGAKCSGMVFQFNTCRNNATGFDQRHGRNSKYIGNSCINSRFIAIHGVGHQIIGNYSDVASGNWNDLGIMGGTVTQDDFVSVSISTGSTQWPRAENCLIAGNIGPVRIGSGAANWSFKAKGNALEQHTGAVVLVDGKHEGTVDKRNQSASVPVPPYVILQPSDVGPLA